MRMYYVEFYAVMAALAVTLFGLLVMVRRQRHLFAEIAEMDTDIYRLFSLIAAREDDIRRDFTNQLEDATHTSIRALEDRLLKYYDERFEYDQLSSIRGYTDAVRDEVVRSHRRLDNHFRTLCAHGDEIDTLNGRTQPAKTGGKGKK